MSERVRNTIAALVIGGSLAVVGAVLATSPPSDADRVAHLASILKCPVCASESIASSPSDLARELHDLIAEQVAAGASDDEVVAFFVATYGEEVLLDPAGGGRSVLLWLLPALAGTIGLALVAGRRRRSADAALADEDRLRVERALQERGQR